MADDERPELPGEAGAAHLPAVRPQAPVVPGAPMLANPMLVAQAMAETMGQAMAAMMRPWLVGLPVPPVLPQVPEPPATGTWSGPGVHVSYTHVEMHWPLGR